MAAQSAQLDCKLYASAFSGEVVFAVKTSEGELYEGVAPKHYAQPHDKLSESPTVGSVRVRLIRNGGQDAVIATPDGESLTVPANNVHY